MSQAAVRRYATLIVDTARAHGLRPSLVAGLVEVESGGNPEALSRAGAVGLGQVMPAERIPGRPSSSALRDPALNLEWSCRILAGNLARLGQQAGALAAYYGACDAEGRPTEAHDGSGATGWEYVRLVEGKAVRFVDLDLWAPPEIRAGGWGDDWPMIFGNVRGVADSALPAGRQMKALAEQIVALWGSR